MPLTKETVACVIDPTHDEIAQNQLHISPIVARSVRPPDCPKWAKRELEDGLKIFVALALMFVGQPRWSVYLVEETFTVLLGIAVLLILILLTVIAFLLLWQGASFVFLRLKGIVGQITSIRDRPLSAEEAMSHPFPRH